MGRRSDHSREEIREMALDAAQQLLESEGPDAVTTRAIGKAIGYAPGTLYNIFADLEDLKLHVNGRSLELLHDDLKQARIEAEKAADAAPVDVVMALARAQLAFIRRHPTLWQMLFRYTLPDGHDVPDWFRARIGESLHELECAIAPAFGADTAGCRDCAKLLWSAFFGICEISSIRKLRLIDSTEVERLTRVMVEGCLMAAPGRKGN